MNRNETASDKIIRAAREIASTQPFAMIQMQDIAQKAGISRATLYRYYTTREQVYAEVTLQWDVGFYERLTSTTRQPRDPRKRVHWVLKSIIDEAQSEPHLIRAFLLCIVQGASGRHERTAEIHLLLPTLLSYALSVPAESLPTRPVRLLQDLLLSSLIGLLRQERDYATVTGDLVYMADILLFPDR